MLEKIKGKHQVTEDDVSRAFVLTRLLRKEWEHDSERGSRLLVHGKVDGHLKPLKAILYPVDPQEGIWRLSTARWGTK